MLHGRADAERATETAQKTFEQGTTATDLPTIEVPRGDLAEGIALFALMVQAGLAASNGEARRLIKGGGARINDVAIAVELATVGLDAVNDDGVIKLSAGRKRHALVRPA